MDGLHREIFSVLIFQRKIGPHVVHGLKNRLGLIFSFSDFPPLPVPIDLIHLLWELVVVEVFLEPFARVGDRVN